MSGTGITNDLSILSDNFGYLPKGLFLGFDKPIVDTVIPGTAYGLFRYEKDGGGGSADTLAFLSGQIFGGTTGSADGANTPAASNHQSSFWTMLSEVDIDVSGSPNYTISRLIFEPAVDHNFDGSLAPDGYFNYSYIGYHNPLYSILSNYSLAGNGTAAFPSQSFYGDTNTGMFTSGDNIGFSTGGTSRIHIYSGGLYPFVTNTYDLGYNDGGGGTDYDFRNIYSVNALSVSSDRRLKEDIQPTNLGLSFVNDLTPVSYKWKEKHDDIMDQRHYGLIAQDVVEVLKNHGIDSLEDFGGILHNGNEKQMYKAKYEHFIPILIKAVQELSDEVKELKEKN